MIRPATRADIPDIVDLGVRHIGESHYAAFITPDRASMAALARWLVDAPCGLLLIDERAGATQGYIGVAITGHPYSGQPVMSELFWYVDRQARGTGLQLLRAAEDWARDLGAVHSIMIAPDSRVSQLYQRLGYARLEEQFIKPL